MRFTEAVHYSVQFDGFEFAAIVLNGNCKSPQWEAQRILVQWHSRRIDSLLKQLLAFRDALHVAVAGVQFGVEGSLLYSNAVKLKIALCLFRQMWLQSDHSLCAPIIMITTMQIWRLWRWCLRQWWMILDPVIVKNPELKEFFCKWWIMTKSRVEGRKNKFFLVQRVDDVKHTKVAKISPEQR